MDGFKYIPLTVSIIIFLQMISFNANSTAGIGGNVTGASLTIINLLPLVLSIFLFLFVVAGVGMHYLTDR